MIVQLTHEEKKDLWTNWKLRGRDRLILRCVVDVAVPVDKEIAPPLPGVWSSASLALTFRRLMSTIVDVPHR